MSGSLRWISWGVHTSGLPLWHLRFGTDGLPLCGRSLSAAVSQRPLNLGAPAVRCEHCTTVIRFQLGLDKPA